MHLPAEEEFCRRRLMAGQAQAQCSGDRRPPRIQFPRGLRRGNHLRFALAGGFDGFGRVVGGARRNRTANLSLDGFADSGRLPTSLTARGLRWRSWERKRLAPIRFCSRAPDTRPFALPPSLPTEGHVRPRNRRRAHRSCRRAAGATVRRTAPAFLSRKSAW